MGHLFISYSRADKKQVGKLVSSLQKEGHDVWLDTEDIEAGALWRQAIVQAIKSGLALIVAISPKSVASRNVRKELDVAEQASVRIIPVRLRPAAIPDSMQYQLAGIQEVDLSSNFKNGLERLTRVLGEDKRVETEAGGRRKKRWLLWTLGGGVVGFLVGTILDVGNLFQDLVFGLIAGAVLGLFGGFLFRVIGWVSKLVGWLVVVLVGAVVGGSVGDAVGLAPGILSLAGASLAVGLALWFQRWRKKRKRQKIAALAGLALDASGKAVPAVAGTPQGVPVKRAGVPGRIFKLLGWLVVLLIGGVAGAFVAMSAGAQGEPLVPAAVGALLAVAVVLLIKRLRRRRKRG